MKKFKLFIVIILSVIASVFMIPAIIYTNYLKEEDRFAKIAANGVQAVAEIIPGSEKTTLSVNGVDYYSIQYKYYDRNGGGHFGRTSSSFTFDEIQELSKNKFINIRYSEITYKSVEDGYQTFSFIKELRPFVIVFGVVDCILWLVVLIIIGKSIRDKIIRRKGTVYTANFISYATNLMVNDVPVYFIKYSWMNDLGELKEDTSNSEYSEYEAILFEKAKTFKIKAVNNESVIISTLAELEKRFRTNEGKSALKNESRCLYCGCLYEDSLNKCPICGAGR